MARIRVASILATVEGSFGSAVMSVKKGREGTMRERVVPANPQTAGQQNVRGAFKGSAQGFKNGSEAMARAWDAYGLTQRSKTGKPLSGIGAYNRLAIVYRLVNPGGTPPTAPPTADYLGPAITVSAQSQANGVLFVGTGPTGANDRVEILLQRLPAGNSKPTLGGYRTVAYAVLNSDDGNEYVAQVGPGRYAAAYRFVNKATGQGTEMVQLSVLGVTLEVVRGGAAEGPAKASARAKKAA